jgi:hypothetical protein
LAGTIEKGDYARFKQLLSENHRYMWAIHLVSSGGDAEEAIKIGRLLRKYLLQADAPAMDDDKGTEGIAFGYPPSVERPLCRGAHCVCASACALIWFGAVQRTGDVGLHRPKITDPQFSALPADEASKRYKDVLKAVSLYLEEMEAPRAQIEAMAATGSSDVRWVITPTKGAPGPLISSPSHIEWIDANCGALTGQDYAVLDRLSQRQSRESKNDHTPLSAPEVALKEKQRKRTACKGVLEYSQRDRMQPP